MQLQVHLGMARLTATGILFSAMYSGRIRLREELSPSILWRIITHLTQSWTINMQRMYVESYIYIKYANGHKVTLKKYIPP